MKLNNYYLHAIDCQNGNSFDGNHSLIVLKNILESNELKSKRLRGIFDDSHNGWNGLDYISLCDYRRKNSRPYENDKFLIGYTAYETYIKQSLSFILKKNKINVIKPQLVAPIIFDWDSHYTMYRLGNSTEGRFSDLPDEIQVKDRIPFNRIRGMAVPIEYMMTEHIPSFKIKNYKYIPPYTAKQVIDYLKILKKVLGDYCVQNELYDLETQILLNDDNDVFRVIDEINHKKNILKK